MDFRNIPTFLKQDDSSESAKLHKKLNELTREFYITGMTDNLSLKIDFEDCFKNLYRQSFIDNYFWQYCPFKVYEATFADRQEEYFEKHFDASALNFWIKEVIEMNEYYQKEGDAKIIEEIVTLNAGYVYYAPGFMGNSEIILDFFTDELVRDIKNTTNKKISYLESQIFPSSFNFWYGRKYYLVDDLNSLLKVHNIKELNYIKQASDTMLKFDTVFKDELDLNTELCLDYSNNSLAERIVFLQELGILDYLQKKMNTELYGFSVNKLAEIVSTFSDIPGKTAQSYLNPMYSPSADQRKNPATTKNLEKVKNKLKDIGLNTTKTN